MTEVSPAQMQRLLGAEFENQGWEYDLTVGRTIVEAALHRGAVDADALAREVPATWLDRNRASRTDVAVAIAQAIGGRTPKAEAPVALTIDKRTYTLHMAEGAQITRSQVNLGGTQITIGADTGKHELLTGVAALVRAGLEGDWNVEALQELADAVTGRGDISYEDVEAVVGEVAEGAREHLEEGRIRRMLQAIAEQSVSGSVAIGLTAGLSELLANLPL